MADFLEQVLKSYVMHEMMHDEEENQDDLDFDMNNEDESGDDWDDDDEKDDWDD